MWKFSIKMISHKKLEINLLINSANNTNTFTWNFRQKFANTCRERYFTLEESQKRLFFPKRLKIKHEFNCNLSNTILVSCCNNSFSTRTNY